MLKQEIDICTIQANIVFYLLDPLFCAVNFLEKVVVAKQEYFFKNKISCCQILIFSFKGTFPNKGLKRFSHPRALKVAGTVILNVSVNIDTSKTASDDHGRQYGTNESLFLKKDGHTSKKKLLCVITFQIKWCKLLDVNCFDNV
eukprot:TRINITY_DN36432_c0_g2_i2.p2 TRINITY_DN36432_c0_g2~~TRINITY_DN36432_c0_g2_i2.p2  ORF type:complete len:144 (-),score=1.43 TRINITY_DN36432_c0_g2_i2:156-587(-)